MKFSLKPLPYPAADLEPHIDAQTMEIHHGKHVQTYVDNLNKALEGKSEYEGWSLEKLLFNLDKLPQELQGPVRNNGGGVFNHDLFFSIMISGGKPLADDGPLKKAIGEAFGSIDEMKAQLKQAGLTQFGSGWAWLVADGDGKLSIQKTPNQDTLVAKNLTPVINLDVWEHAYYLKCQNRRAEYIDNWFNVVNWEAAEQNYANHKSTDYSKA